AVLVADCGSEDMSSRVGVRLI
ncbi:MAG: hypothetical protein QG670_2273, partial [Thermoproteota archaeon]|nr:hypothetical protein [Thermoproteota archaeon]